MTEFYEKMMSDRVGIEFVRDNGIVVGCQNAEGLIRCNACEYVECPMREVD